MSFGRAISGWSISSTRLHSAPLVHYFSQSCICPHSLPHPPAPATTSSIPLIIRHIEDHLSTRTAIHHPASHQSLRTTVPSTLPPCTTPSTHERLIPPYNHHTLRAPFPRSPKSSSSLNDTSHFPGARRRRRTGRIIPYHTERIPLDIPKTVSRDIPGYVLS